MDKSQSSNDTMKKFIVERKTLLSLLAIGVYALAGYLAYWLTGDLTISIIIAALIMVGDFAVLAYIFRNELKDRFGSKRI